MVSETKPETPAKAKLDRTISVRTQLRSYLIAAFIGSFFAALAFYLEFPLIAYTLIVFAWIVVPFLAVTDKVVFDGRRLHRSGMLPRLWAYLVGARFWLKARDIEQVETRCSPTLKRGGRIYFRYQTVVSGKGLELTFASTSADYRTLVKTLFRLLPEEVMDAGSIELRDYLEDSRYARKQARKSDIPPPDVLENAFRASTIKQRADRRTAGGVTAGSAEKALSLRHLGNQLRLSGSLLQAMESFRRAASIRPDDPWLLFDFARCIQAFAGTEGSAVLERKAAAMMRLAERRAGGDGRLLARLGETYSQLGEWHRASIAFRKAVDAVGEQFCTIRGMAEIALRDGKLAHVVHNFYAASRLAESSAARRWSRAEAEYFSRLNSDDEYMDMELGRVNLLDALDRWKGTTFRLGLAGFPVIGLGLYLEDATIANGGWILSGGMLVLWTAILLASRAFSARIEPELLSED